MKSELFSEQTPVIIQGMTGKEGSRMAQWLIRSGVNVAAGVTPGKAGQSIEGRPIFNSVGEARAAFPNVDISSIAVPPARVLGAAIEAIEAGISLVHILTEQVPIHDVLAIKKAATEKGVTLFGPSSVGYLQFPRFRIGYLGGESPFEVIKEGSVALISTSGGMTNELMMSLAKNGVGIRTASALGGDRVIGFSLEDSIRWNESLEEVKVLGIFIEPGRPLLRALISGKFEFRKPTVLFLAGESLDQMPRGVSYGHTGTILGEDELSVSDTLKKLNDIGIACVRSQSEFILQMMSYVT
jgi:succinyl-CoA synthetase alpha subunit